MPMLRKPLSCMGPQLMLQSKKRKEKKIERSCQGKGIIKKIDNDLELHLDVSDLELLEIDNQGVLLEVSGVHRC